MIKHTKKKITAALVLFTIVFSLMQVVFTGTVPVLAAGLTLDTVAGDLLWDKGVAVDEGSAVFQLPVQEDRYPRKLEWYWQGSGQVWASVEYSDKNQIYYVLAGTEAPAVSRTTFIDQNGVPRIVVPVLAEIPRGAVSVDLLEDYCRYYGKKEISVEKVCFGLKAAGYTEIKDLAVGEYVSQKEAASKEGSELLKNIHLQVQIPQGSKDAFYLVKDVEFPVQVEIRTLLDKSEKGNMTIAFPGTVTITSYDAAKLSLDGDNKLSMPLAVGPGYATESFVVMVKASGPGRLAAQVQLGQETEKLEKDIDCPDLESIRSSLTFLDEGVYPMEHSSHKVTLKKELKNYIKVREDIFSTLHKLFGAKEEHDKPTGLVCGVLQNSTGYYLPLHVKFSVLDANGEEITYFRGEHFQREESAEPPVPETVIGVAEDGTRDFKMPLFADVYSVKPGVYKGMLKVSLFGSEAEIAVREFDLHVEKESQLQIAVGSVAVFLSLLSIFLMAAKQKKWIKRLKTSEIILIALFTAVKFSIVDIPWFVFGDVVRAVLGPLGPFMSIFTGVFWDILNAMFLVALIVLVPKPGVVIISSVVRIILQGIAFGTFNPITILLMLSYALLADALLYFTGFTREKRAFKAGLATFSILGIIFAVQHVYSTYTFYYIWMYLYRLFYPDWYINMSAIVSVVYSVLGAVMGVYLGNKLKRVVE